MNQKIQNKIITEALDAETANQASVSKKFISTLISFCTAFNRTNKDSYEDWRRTEFRETYVRPREDFNSPIYRRFM